MKEKLVDQLPKCDFKDDFPHPDGDDALYDAPTNAGSWAYMCEACAASLSNKACLNIGFKFVVRQKYEGETPDKPVRSIEPDLNDIEYWEGVVMDGLREPECGNCGESRSMEPDATRFTCEGCGAKNIMSGGLF